MKQAKRHDIQAGIISAVLALVTASAASAAGLVSLEFNSRRDWTEGWGFRQGRLEFATVRRGRSSSARIPTPAEFAETPMEASRAAECPPMLAGTGCDALGYISRGCVDLC